MFKKENERQETEGDFLIQEEISQKSSISKQDCNVGQEIEESSVFYEEKIVIKSKQFDLSQHWGLKGSSQGEPTEANKILKDHDKDQNCSSLNESSIDNELSRRLKLQEDTIIDENPKEKERCIQLSYNQGDNQNLFARQSQSQLLEKELIQDVSRVFSSGNSEEIAISEQKRDNQQNEGNLQKNYTVKNKDNTDFLVKHFGNQETILFDDFLNSIYDDFGDLLEFQDEEEQIHLEDTLNQMLNTSLTSNISLNALDIFTKEMSLQESIQKVAEEIKQKRNQEIEQARKKYGDTIHDNIFEEIDQLKRNLESKRRNLARRQREVQKREKEISLKEINFKELLQGELDTMLMSLDQKIHERNIEVIKKSAQLEKNMKAKMKILEAKAKEIKTQNTQSTAQDDKLKAKIAANEKTTEFLKTKAQEAERKLILEQDKNAALQIKIDNLLKKNKALERKVQEFDLSFQTADSIAQGEQLVIPQDSNINPLPLSQSENQSSDQDQLQIKDDSIISESQQTLPDNIMNPSTENTSKTPQQWDIPATITSKKTTISINQVKKKTPIGPMGSSTTSADDEAKVLLSVVYTLLNNLKTTLPLMLSQQNQNQTIYHNNQIPIQAVIASIQNNPAETGELFFPCYNNLISNLVEIVPSLLTHPCNSKHLYNIIDLMFNTISFKFRYDLFKQNKEKSFNFTSMLSEELLENTRDAIKTGQDHINEIMMNPKNSTELTFIPQTAFWKRKSKIVIKKTTSTSNLPEKLPQKIGFQLFENVNVQKELVSVFRQYLEASEFQLKREDLSSKKQIDTHELNQLQSFVIIADQYKSQNAASISFEKQKYILLSRINLQLMTLILQVNSKESSYALSSLQQDICGNNQDLNNYLRQYLVKQHFVQILIWRMIESSEDQSLIEQSIQLIFSIASKGSHYEQYIQDMSENDILNKLIILFEKYCNSKDITEKLTEILKKIITHKNELKHLIDSRCIMVFKNKLSEAEKNTNEDNQIIIQNIQYILNNLDTITSQ